VILSEKSLYQEPNSIAGVEWTEVCKGWFSESMNKVFREEQNLLSTLSPVDLREKTAVYVII